MGRSDWEIIGAFDEPEHPEMLIQTNDVDSKINRLVHDRIEETKTIAGVSQDAVEAAVATVTGIVNTLEGMNWTDISNELPALPDIDFNFSVDMKDVLSQPQKAHQAYLILHMVS